MNNMPSEQQITAAIERILRRGEFSGADYSWLLDKIRLPSGRALPQIMETMGVFGKIVMIALVAAMLLGLLWLIYSERRRRLASHNKLQSPGQSLVADPLAQAEELARKEDWAGALLALYALHLQTLHRQGWIVLDESKTGLQYQWELLRTGYDDVEGFAALRKVFNRVRYGGYAELRETYETFLAYCRNRPERRRAA